jgi:osmotically-inducible protein OsmY
MTLGARRAIVHSINGRRPPRLFGGAGGDRERMTMPDVGQHVTQDRDIERAVRAELGVSLDANGHRLVSVTVHEGVVSLAGFVDSYAQKWAAERAAARVVGVRDVRDYLEVLPPDDSCADGPIRTAVQRALDWDARVPDGVHGEVTDGVVRLHGVVGRLSEREAAEEAVRNLTGVRDVVNEIRVAHIPVGGHLETDVEAAIRRRYAAEAGRIGISTADGVVTLSGVVPTLAMLEEIERTVRSLRGVTRIDNQLLVA